MPAAGPKRRPVSAMCPSHRRERSEAETQFLEAIREQALRVMQQSTSGEQKQDASSTIPTSEETSQASAQSPALAKMEVSQTVLESVISKMLLLVDRPDCAFARDFLEKLNDDVSADLSLLTNPVPLSFACMHVSKMRTAAAAGSSVAEASLVLCNVNRTMVYVPCFATGNISVGGCFGSINGTTMGRVKSEEYYIGRYIRDESTGETIVVSSSVMGEAFLPLAVAYHNHRTSTLHEHSVVVCSADSTLEAESLASNALLGLAAIETRLCPTCEALPYVNCGCRVAVKPLDHPMDFGTMANNMMTHASRQFNGSANMFFRIAGPPGGGLSSRPESFAPGSMPAPSGPLVMGSASWSCEFDMSPDASAVARLLSHIVQMRLTRSIPHPLTRDGALSDPAGAQARSLSVPNTSANDPGGGSDLRQQFAVASTQSPLIGSPSFARARRVQIELGDLDSPARVGVTVGAETTTMRTTSTSTMNIPNVSADAIALNPSPRLTMGALATGLGPDAAVGRLETLESRQTRTTTNFLQGRLQWSLDEGHSDPIITTAAEAQAASGSSNSSFAIHAQAVPDFGVQATGSSSDRDSSGQDDGDSEEDRPAGPANEGPSSPRKRRRTVPTDEDERARQRREKNRQSAARSNARRRAHLLATRRGLQEAKQRVRVLEAQQRRLEIEKVRLLEILAKRRPNSPE